MVNLKISVFKSGQEKPDTVVTIPLKVVKVISKLLPVKAKIHLEEEGVDLNEIARLAEREDLRGTLVEVEKENERVTITIE
jgi:hypothetical protein